MEASNFEPKFKVISLKPPKNPELEKLRECGLSGKTNFDDITILKEQVKNIHAAYLFTPEGVKVLANLCKVISSTPTSLVFSSWKDLAGYFGLTFHEIGCIENIKSDPTEIVLKTFAQHADSTLDTILSALQFINRYDAAVEIKNGFQELESVARREQIKRTENIYAEVNPVTQGKGTSDGILRPEHWSMLPSQLPITLKLFPSISKENKEVIVSIDNDVPKNEDELQTSSVVPKKKVKKFSKAIMLTFAADGEEIARKIAAQFRKPRGKHLPIGVLLLEEHIDKVLQNPEEFIVHIFPQMNYIVPILTEGYLLSLKRYSHHQGSSLSSIDSIYVKFIHDLMMKYYVQNQCRNDKFRCIIPDDQYKILDHKHMELDPVLKVYLKESEVEELACRMLKISWKNNQFNRGV